MQDDEGTDSVPRDEEKKDDDDDDVTQVQTDSKQRKTESESSSLRAEKLRLAPASEPIIGDVGVPRLSFQSSTFEKLRLSPMGSERLRLAPGSIRIDGNGSSMHLSTRFAKIMEPDIEVAPASVPTRYHQHGAVRIGSIDHSGEIKESFETDDIESGNLVEAQVVNEVETLQEEVQRLRGSLEAMRAEQRRSQIQQNQDEEPKVVVVAVEEKSSSCNKTIWIVVVVLLIIAGGIAGVLFSGVMDKHASTPAEIPPVLAGTESPTAATTSTPTKAPSSAPTLAPTTPPTKAPTLAPITPLPTMTPTVAPTPNPTLVPSPGPTNAPTLRPTPNPTTQPTPNPTPIPTAPPTQSPTRVTLEFLLADYTPLNVQAITWLQSSTWRPEQGDPNSVYYMLERYALACLYFSTTGPSWSQSINWLSPSEPVCNWFTSGTNSECRGPLKTLHLAANGLQGSIPSVLFALTALTYLDLSANQLTGSIPESLGNMGGSLQQLRLQSNQLTGTIPKSVSDMRDLESLYLQDNQLSGSVPALPFIDVACYLDNNCFQDASNAASGNCRVLNNCT